MSDTKNTVAEVCSLDAPTLRERLDFVRREISPHVVSQETFDGGLAWEFESSAQTRERLERLILVERRCCGAWKFELHDVAATARLRLEVHGADSKSGLLEAFTDSAADKC